MHVLQSLSMIGVLAISAAAAVPDDPHNVTPEGGCCTRASRKHVDAATLAKMKTYGIDLETTQGTTRHELPVPSVFIVDRSGVIRFRHYDPDYTVRLDAAHVLAAAKSAQVRSGH
jgi:hypothetical protein